MAIKQLQNLPKQQKQQPEPEKPKLSARDSARLQTNLPQWANRFVSIGGKTYPVMHLSIAELEEFRAAITPFENLMEKLGAGQYGSFADFCSIHAGVIGSLLVNEVPYAAALTLRCTMDAVLKLGAHPLELFRAVLEQWHHNSEIAELRKLFPYPPDDENDSIDPENDNPMSVAERLASAYHWSFEESLSRTLPQVYLMGVNAAWSYKRMKDKTDKDYKPGSSRQAQLHPDIRRDQKGGLDYEGKHYGSLKEMPQKIYRQYIDDMMRGPRR